MTHRERLLKVARGEMVDIPYDIGADGYAQDAGEVIVLVKSLLVDSSHHVWTNSR